MASTSKSASKRKTKKRSASKSPELPPLPTETKSESDKRKDMLMNYDPYRTILTQCLEHATTGDAGAFVENPAVQFTKDARAGEYDHLSDDEYNALLSRVEELASLWHNQPRRPAGDILLSMLEQTTISRESLGGVADALLEWHNSRYDLPDIDDAISWNKVSITEEQAEAVTSATLDAAFATRRPKEIHDAVSARVLCQPEGTRAAAMIVHGQLSGRRSNAVFCGPSGCGKSEIWRCLAREFPGLIRIVDFSRMCGEGWNGSLHLRDVFEGVNADDIRRRGLIVVLDEADKILCETAVSSTGNNHNHIVQNNLLKMLDGDTIEFGSESGKGALSVDCSRISVVMLGAFENLMTAKAAAKAKRIGFGSAPEAAPPSHKDISYDDLIKAGARREIAGRINRIVAMAPLDAAGYKAILDGPVLSDLEKAFRCKVTLDDAAADTLSEQAVASGLGVRWAKSAMYSAIEDALFEEDNADKYKVEMRDGRLFCRAEKRAPGGQEFIYEDMALPF